MANMSNLSPSKRPNISTNSIKSNDLNNKSLSHPKVINEECDLSKLTENEDVYNLSVSNVDSKEDNKIVTSWNISTH